MGKEKKKERKLKNSLFVCVASRPIYDFDKVTINTSFDIFHKCSCMCVFLFL